MNTQISQQTLVIIENVAKQTFSPFFLKIRRQYGMITNETTIHQISNEVDVSNYRQLHELQQ